jgi:hypothetical protein
MSKASISFPLVNSTLGRSVSRSVGPSVRLSVLDGEWSHCSPREDRVDGLGPVVTAIAPGVLLTMLHGKQKRPGIGLRAAAAEQTAQEEE